MSFYLGLSILSNVNRHKRTYRQKLLSVEAKHMVSQLSGRPLAEHEIAREEQGRPFFPDYKADFSISHSWDLAAVSLVTGGNLRTGCDVELVRPRKSAKEISEKYFSANERDYIFSPRRFELAKFYEIWTLKECFLKLRGLSVFDMATVPSFISRGDFALDADVFPQLSFYRYELAGAGEKRYILASVVEGTGGVQPEVRWFSRNSLSCKIIATPI